MSSVPVSVIVVSRGRPDALLLCLKSLSQLVYAPYEIIVVADGSGCEAVERAGLSERLKLVRFDEPNLSQGRNLGLREAAGEIVAFIDDDAVAEPTWLTHLTAPIAEGDAESAGGYVRGRNGISYQWTARDVQADGGSDSIAVAGDAPVLVQPRAGWGAKTEGTNMAFRRETLCGMGGFDEAFAFYLDETDVNMRMAEAGHVTAIVPLAQVHHGYRESERRADDRTPRDLFQIGRSTAIYLRKHAGDALEDDLAEARVGQRRRLISYMVGGQMMPGDVARLLESWDRGVSEGREAQMGQYGRDWGATLFIGFTSTAQGRHAAFACRWYNVKRVMKRALEAQREGATVSVFRYSLTALFHSVWFTREGVWVQRGGLFGRSDRQQPIFTICTKKQRTAKELTRVEKVRFL